MRIIINLSTENAAFEDNAEEEFRDCLFSAAAKIVNGDDSGAIMDSNGNRVGSFHVDGR